MSNPVPPPAGRPYQPGDAGLPGQPYQPGPSYPPGQPAQPYQPGPGYPPGQPAQPYQPGPGQPGQQQFPPGPDGQPIHPAYPGSDAPQFGALPPEKKKSMVGKTALRVGAAIVVLLVVFLAKSFVFGDKAKDAKAGDCIAADKNVSTAGTTKTGATVVDCGSADAKFSVVARIDGKTDTKGTDCDKFFQENDQYFIYSSTAGQGYLLCLKPKA